MSHRGRHTHAQQLQRLQGADEPIVAPFTYASELGFIRKDDVFSTIDVLNVEIAAGRSDAGRQRKVTLVLPDECRNNKARGFTQTLLSTETMTHEKIPAGSIIHQLTVAKSTSDELDCDLSLILGVWSPDLHTKEAQRAVAQRFASEDAPLTGPFLNRHLLVNFSAVLGPQTLTDQLEIYERDEAANEDNLGDDEGDCPDYAVVTENVTVGELKPVYIAATILNGSVSSCQLTFVLTYTPPPCPAETC